MLTDAVLSALVNVVVLAGLPYLFYFCYHRWRHKRASRDIAHRAGLRIGEAKYIGYCLVVALATVGIVVMWPPPLEFSMAEGSAFRQFAGLGLGGSAVTMALAYGVLKTGFAEELLFRGLIAGSLSRRLSIGWAVLVQALIFLAPHLLFVTAAPETWLILTVIFVGTCFVGWVRIKSGSILGPWLIHATANVTMALSVAIRSAA